MIKVGFKRLSDAASIPTKAHPTDSGFDLYAAEDTIIEPGQTVVIPTGIAVKLPPGYEAQVRPRSGVTSRTKLRVQLGTIDNGYTGEIGVIVDNNKAQGKKVDINGGFTGLSNLEVTYAYTLNGNDLETGYKIGYGTYLIRKGDRIAQLVIQPIPAVESYEIKDDLDDTNRGDKGFGSTGMRSANEWKDAFDSMVQSAKTNDGGYLH